MPRKGENIHKRKDGRWEGRFIKGRTIEGKAIYGYLYAKSYREIKIKMSNVDKFSCKKEIYSISKDTMKFQSLANAWIISLSPHIKESTNIKYHNLLNKYILPCLGNVKICDISHEILTRFCNQLLLEGGCSKNGLSPKTVADVLSVIKNVLQFSENQGIIISCNASTITIKQCKRELRILSRLEQEILRNYLYANLNERNLGILICMFTGMRIGEICALRWEDISIEHKVIHVHQTMQRLQCNGDNGKKTKILISTPKSVCSIRDIPLPENLVCILAEYEQASSVYVLTGRADKYVEPRTMQNHLKRIMKQCSIEDINFHALRHTFATRCIELGFDVKSLSELLGHASVNITMNRYVHPSMELKRENMNRLSDLILVK